MALFIKRLTDDDQARPIFHGDICNLRRVHEPRNVLDDRQGTGDRPRWIAESKTNPFFAVINRQDSQICSSRGPQNAARRYWQRSTKMLRQRYRLEQNPLFIIHPSYFIP